MLPPYFTSSGLATVLSSPFDLLESRSSKTVLGGTGLPDFMAVVLQSPTPGLSPRANARKTIAAVLALLLFLKFFLFNPTASVSFRTTSGPLLPGDIRHILNETLGFEKIYVLHLPSRSDRRDSMSLAARLTGLKVEYVDAVTSAEEKHLPPVEFKGTLKPAEFANWRSHMNAVRKIVEDGVTSALIIEDDVDWDIRIKSQMQNFARGTRLLLQPLKGSPSTFVDPTFHGHKDSDEPTNFDIKRLADTVPPKDSPYGDLHRWDLLWPGHCGYRFPNASHSMPLGRVPYHDPSVAETQHFIPQFSDDELIDEYANHTRVVSRVYGAVCLFAYAMNQAGAMKWLRDIGIDRITSYNDVMYSELCDGRSNRETGSCVSIQPQLFDHHRTGGDVHRWSDIDDKVAVNNPQAFTKNIRWSTRINFPQLLNRKTDYFDTFPDGAERHEFPNF